MLLGVVVVTEKGRWKQVLQEAGLPCHDALRRLYTGRHCILSNT